MMLIVQLLTVISIPRQERGQPPAHGDPFRKRGAGVAALFDSGLPPWCICVLGS